MLNMNLEMYGKTTKKAIENINRLSKDNERKTITIVLSKDKGKTIYKKQIKKRKFKNAYYDNLLKAIVICTYTDNGFIEKYYHPEDIVNIY